ncbi:MAG: bifunctional (p)ppGpp synthetase/guanosine-3',5'-bis(diphosphate) 3'-pyrophosphohydrolase [Syntrophobacteraceae bacterium]
MAETTEVAGETRPSAPVGAGETHFFDIAAFRTRMSKSLDPANSNYALFFDALEFARELHEGQRRKSGAPYISHPCSVVEILVREMQFRDPLLLAAALLHDVVEDVPWLSLDDVESRFGAPVAELVDGCTKLARYHLDRAALKDLTHSKIFISASRRLGVLIIKLADRLHNLRTLHYLPLTKRQRIAQETVEVYAPIAARLNLYPVKRELYHLALSFLYPKKSKKILHIMRDIRHSPDVARIEADLGKLLADSELTGAVRTRPKGLGSYYDPLKRTLDPLYPENYIDFAIILQTEDITACYRVLGLVNNGFAVIPRSLRDFIANPKTNAYRSLHTRIHLSGSNYLIKIRTAEMEEWASGGILRAWDAQKGLSDEHWQEISELLRDIGEYGGAATQRKALIRLSEADEIYAYSPRGDIYYLPKSSIVLDFAYRIHSELGDNCEGALVNGIWLPITGQIKDGDTVEILTSSEPLDVDADLEGLCKTPKARTAINRRLQQKRLQFAQEVGRDILLQEIVRHRLPSSVLEGDHIRLILEILNLKDLQELYIQIGQDLASPQLVLYYLEGNDPDQVLKPSEADEHEQNVISVSSLDKAIFKFARCCNPLPGQEKVVATLSERGITIHHGDCADLHERHSLQPQQLLHVRWNARSTWRHPLVFRIHILEQSLRGLLPKLAELPERIRILQMSAGLDRHNQEMVSLSVLFHNIDEAKEFFNHLPMERTVVDEFGRQGRPRQSEEI